MSLIIDRPANPSGLYIVCDVRFKHDRELEENGKGPAVMREWAFGKASLGRAAWAQTTRVALYDYGSDTETLSAAQETEITSLPEKKQKKRRKALIAANRAAKRAELIAFLKAEKPSLIVVIATRGAEIKMKDEDIGDAKNLKGTMSWDAMHAPDSIPEMAGTVWTSPEVGRVMAMLNPANHEYVWGWQIRNWLLGADAIVRGRMPVLFPGESFLVSEPGPKLLRSLKAIQALAEAGSPVSIDIETVPSEDIITCIGLAAGPWAVSIPWDPFPIAGGSKEEPAGPIMAKHLAVSIMASSAPKVFHNGFYDVPFLAKRGMAVGGRHEDTYLLHGVAYRQFRHGLQRAVATEFIPIPWKSEHADPSYNKSSKAAWTSKPKHLRHYNALDAWYTLRLYEALRLKVGI